MLSYEEYVQVFENVKDALFENCISKEECNNWSVENKYIRYTLKLSVNLGELLKENDKYHEITDIISNKNFESVVKDIYYDEINKYEYVDDIWSGFATTQKCFLDYEGDLNKIENVLKNKLEILKDAFIKNLYSTYEKYVKAYELKQEYIDFANNIKKVGFVVCDYQRRGELRVPCTFSKQINQLCLYVRKNANNYRVYMKCDIGGRYGMTVEEFDESYQILKQETNNIKNALMGEEII